VYRQIALVLTVVFQPLIVPSLVVALLFYVLPESTSVPAANRGSIWLLVMETTLLIPMLSVTGMRLTAFLPSLKMHTKEERVWPFTATSIFYVMTWCFFYFKLYIDPLLVFSLGVIALCVVLLTFITYFWKISAHLTGLSGLLAIMVVLAQRFPAYEMMYTMMATVIICGLVASARLYLHAHKPSEILGGFLLGFSVCFSAFYFYPF